MAYKTDREYSGIDLEGKYFVTEWLKLKKVLHFSLTFVTSSNNFPVTNDYVNYNLLLENGDFKNSIIIFVCGSSNYVCIPYLVITGESNVRKGFELQTCR